MSFTGDLSVGAQWRTAPVATAGASRRRLPFDFLLHSLAEEFGARVVCIVLSGTGADGSAGLKAVKAKGGLVIAQDPTKPATMACRETRS